jgi:hypothetical protein
MDDEQQWELCQCNFPHSCKSVFLICFKYKNIGLLKAFDLRLNRIKIFFYGT